LNQKQTIQRVGRSKKLQQPLRPVELEAKGFEEGLLFARDIGA